jgi:hypothetical protein
MFQFSLEMQLVYKLIRIEQPWLPQDDGRRVVVAIIKDLGFHSLTTKGTMVPYQGRLQEQMEEVDAENRI